MQLHLNSPFSHWLTSFREESTRTWCLQPKLQRLIMHNYSKCIINSFIHKYVQTSMHIYMHAHVYSYTHACIHTSILYENTYIHTYIQTYRHTYIHTMHVQLCKIRALVVRLRHGLAVVNSLRIRRQNAVKTRRFWNRDN